MKAYLRIVNPALAVLVLMLCVWAAIFNDGKLEPFGVFAGGLSSYFFAKGLFSSSAVFILGKILLEVIGFREKQTPQKPSMLEWTYIFVIVGFFISAVIGTLILDLVPDGRQKKPEKVGSAGEIVLVEHHLVPEATKVRIAGKIKNAAGFGWDKLSLSARVYIGGRYAGTCTENIPEMLAGAEKFFAIECYGLENSNIKEPLSYEMETPWAEKK